MNMYKPQVTNKKMQEGWSKFKDLCLALNKLSNPQEFFDLYFTPSEREDLTSRYLIVQALLESKLSQREIAEKLEVSIAKITRGSNELKSCSPELLEFIKNK